jgi:hypothetical protein
MRLFAARDTTMCVVSEACHLLLPNAKQLESEFHIISPTEVSGSRDGDTKMDVFWGAVLFSFIEIDSRSESSFCLQL